MCWRKKAVSLGTIVTLLLAGCVLFSGRMAMSAQEGNQSAKASQAAAPAQPPMTENDLIKLIKHNKKDLQVVAKEVHDRGLDFEFTPKFEQKLTKMGAADQLITYLKQFTPSARAARKASGGPEVSEAEAGAYNKIKQEREDADATIKDAEAFAQQFPKSPLLTYVYAFEATAYQQKNDAANVVKCGEKSLKLDPKNLMSLLVVSQVLPQPQMLENVGDVQKQKTLNEAAKYAHKALAEIEQLPKLPKESNAAYRKRKDQISAGAYASLGMVHLELSRMSLEGPDMGELAKAEQNYKTAIAKSDPPSPADYYRLGEVYATEKKLDDAISAFTQAGQLAQGTVIENLANQEIQRLKKAKASQSKAAAKP